MHDKITMSKNIAWSNNKIFLHFFKNESLSEISTSITCVGLFRFPCDGLSDTYSVSDFS